MVQLMEMIQMRRPSSPERHNATDVAKKSGYIIDAVEPANDGADQKEKAIKVSMHYWKLIDAISRNFGINNLRVVVDQLLSGRIEEEFERSKLYQLEVARKLVAEAEEKAKQRKKK